MSLYVYGSYTQHTRPVNNDGLGVEPSKEHYHHYTQYASSVEEVIAHCAEAIDKVKAAGEIPDSDIPWYDSFVASARVNHDRPLLQLVSPNGTVWWWLRLV